MIFQKIQDDIKEAMKARDTARLGCLRFLHSELKNVHINEKVEITDPIALQVISKLAKQRREGIEEFTRAGRAELAAKEQAELRILESYLPQAMSPEAIKEAVRQVIQETGAASKRDMGKVMKAAIAKLAGQADSKAIQSAASQLLP